MINDIDPIPPFRGEDYEKFYGDIDYSNKTVLDIGADYGSTAYWFIQKGASSVIAVDADNGYYQRMVQSFSRTNKVEPLHITINSGETVKELILKYKPHIIKVDCEGCESVLLSLSGDILKIADVYLIETHDHSMHDLIKQLLGGLGYKIGRDWNWSGVVWMSSWEKV